MNNRGVQVSVAAALVFFAMVFLWLRENEMRVSAEKKYQDMKFKLDAQSNEQANLANELELKIGEAEGKLADTVARYTRDMNEKEAVVSQLSSERDDLTAELKRTSDQFTQYQAKSRELEANYAKQINAKNSEISELGAQLKEQAVKLETLYKEKASLESRLMESQKKLGALEAELAQARAAAIPAFAAEAPTPITD